MDKPIVRVADLYKAFGPNEVLKGVNLEIQEKSICAIIGQSGTGKSVLFKSIIGMLTPDKGRVWFKDTELTALPKAELMDIRKYFGYSFQNAALFDSMTVGENIEFPLREVLHMKNKKEIKKKVTEMLEWIELPDIASKRPDELSGGMRKRVGVARSLVMRPEVLFFDEPTTGLDPVLSETIYNLVVRVNKELSITCVLITHDIPAAFRISDKIAFLDQGCIIADGTPGEVAQSDHALVKDFIRLSFSELAV
ncbi:ABC transporter ATP-binding protein [Breznakiella homolactica]|uniref:ATP-binding cassette domain-containing protein n=1 Tax=Breznakiella homolactica TaxID=2798577 RepID=A0A7T8BBB2_9SPIR|nr:ATP-binding cassette domain-containing protein [Breznakiella homolactica]QQO09860.1 ATP-binding cassette domain-containing protein [Breznakiella homolactica]